QITLPESQIDEAVQKILSETGIPSASIAVARDRTIYAKAYGNARLNPATPATPEMRYKIASNSKQIAATAILLLAQEHKLSLDDTVARFLPTLTRAREVTLRELLSHTSGYQDYYPLDYVAPFMTRDVTAAQILDQWAKKPLDFEPGTRWQYSNTNYVIIGQIVEKLTGKPLIEFLRARIFHPLGMRSVIDVTREQWSTADPAGYSQFALAAPREATPEGNGWMYAAGELAMTARDLALWDASLIEGTVLKPESLKALTTEVLLKGGSGTHYALGMEVSTTAKGSRRWSHSGGASGFISRNTTFPDDKISITVLTNGEGPAAGTIARRLEDLLFASTADPGAAPALENAKKLFTGLQNGEIDRTLIDGDLSAYFSAEAVADFASSLKPLGKPESFTAGAHEDRGGMTFRGYAVKFGAKAIRISTFVTPEGKFAQFLISAVPRQ
ncbi:MAG: D-alanyl-D-alanine carboxypeptidase, partial [Bryobacterales bacterium]|nr:D-alanyl-D-alanine carboxypeptidase [Bryobacterales bacterium]